MSTTLKARFETRRDAEMTVEHLVQEYGIERTDIFVSPVGDQNTAGDHAAGSDMPASAPTPEARDDAAIAGAVLVSVDLQDDDAAEAVQKAFQEFNGQVSSPD